MNERKLYPLRGCIMPRKKRSSSVLAKAEQRAAALKSISETLDLSYGLTLESFTTQIEGLRALLAEYNTVLSNLDKAANEITTNERSLSDLCELMLMGVATKYGKNSNEYEMAGGIRKSDRKRPVRTKAGTVV